MIRAGDITFHRHGWPENMTVEVAQELWAEQEQKMKDVLEGAIKPVFPRIVRAGSETEMSPECQASMLKMILALRGMKAWAVNMVDASGKLPNGMFSGTAAVFGHFDQCLAVSMGDPEEGGFRGKYCYVKSTAPNLPRPSFDSSDVVLDSESILNWFYQNAYWIQQFGTRMGVCVPSQCTDDDVTKMISYMFSGVNGDAKVVDCYEEEASWQLDSMQCLVLIILIALFVFCVLCTVYELLWEESFSFAHKFLINFSLVHNSKKLFQVNKSKRDISILHGIRTISCAWIVLGHIYFLTDLDSFARFGSLRKLEGLFNNFLFTAVENFSLPVDTFFAVTGLLIMWTTKPEAEFSVKSWLSQMWHRIYRIYPCYFLMHGLCVLLTAMGSGPIWNETFSPVYRNLYSTGWLDLLFVNNYVHWKRNMMVHTWFIAMNVQFCFIGIPLAHFLRKRTRLAVLIMTLVSLAGCLIATGLMYINEYPPTMLMMTAQYEKAVDFISYVYYLPTTHFGPFCMGLVLGHLLVEGYAPKFGTLTLILGNLSALFLMFSAVFGAYPFRAGWPIDYSWIAFYGGFHRIIWTLGVCWFIFLSQTGQGGVISSLLSADFWQPFSSLSFTVYLLHPVPIILYVATTKEIQQLDHFYQTIFFLGIWTISNMIGYIAHIAVELPFAGLEKLFKLENNKKAQISLKHSNNNSNANGKPYCSRHLEVLTSTRTPSSDHRVNFDSDVVTKYKF